MGAQGSCSLPSPPALQQPQGWHGGSSVALPELLHVLGWSIGEGSVSGTIPGPCWRQQHFCLAGNHSFPNAEELLGLTVTQGWACGNATVLGLCQEPGQLEPVLGTVGSWCARRDMRDPRVPPLMTCSDFMGRGTAAPWLEQQLWTSLHSPRASPDPAAAGISRVLAE